MPPRCVSVRRSGDDNNRRQHENTTPVRDRCRKVTDAIVEDAPDCAAPELWRALTVAVEGINAALAGVNVFAADTILTAVAEELGADLGGIE